jgi:hypothetical protein
VADLQDKRGPFSKKQTNLEYAAATAPLPHLQYPLLTLGKLMRPFSLAVLNLPCILPPVAEKELAVLR